jgi:hypothetical protein
MAESDDNIWLHRTYYQESITLFGQAWDIYIKFYTVFLTVNVTGLGLVAHFSPSRNSRIPMIAAFCIQNAISACVSAVMGSYGKQVDIRLGRVAEFLSSRQIIDGSVSDVTKGSPVPSIVSKWAGYGNCIASLCMIGCWIGSYFF